jgi:hypothetical protein
MRSSATAASRQTTRITRARKRRRNGRKSEHREQKDGEQFSHATIQTQTACSQAGRRAFIGYDYAL